MRTRQQRSTVGMLAGALALILTGCGDDGGAMAPDGGGPRDGGGDGDAGAGVEVPETYEFESGLTEGESSVSYSGQIARHVLIEDLVGFIGRTTEMVDGASFPGTGSGRPEADGDVVGALDFWFRFSEADEGEEIRLETEPSTLQSSYGDIASGKDLVGKLAGNDDVTDHMDWDGGDFRGWTDTSIAAAGGSVDSPEGLVVAFFETIEENAIARAGGATRTAPGHDGALPVHVTEQGQDLSQLVEKLLLMAITYSQGTDDYLDSGESGVDGKGLLAGNVESDEGAPYTPLEHQWDEGFGYFGAARDYGAYTDEEIAGKGGREGWSDGYHDTDGDGMIDLTSEYNFGQSTNAAKRDLGASDEAPTDFTGEAWEAFRTGRAIINQAVGRELTSEEMTLLEEQRDIAVLAWEKAIAATVVHYINDTLEDMSKLGTDDYDFLAHAKHWSELKGFALGLQLNPRSRVSGSDFEMLHELVGDAPVLSDASETEISDYQADLLSARDLLQSAYGFDEANMGDDDGLGGW